MVLKPFDHTFQSGDKVAILGGNGSGKSTFLKLLSGALSPSGGEINIESDQSKLDVSAWMRSVAFCAPYTELIESYTLDELAEFQSSFRPFRNNIQAKDILEIAELGHARNKEIKHFSSGMRQRAKLALTILSDTPILLLDEPVSNLDKKAMAWMKNLLVEHLGNRIFVVGSNYQPEEIALCTEGITIQSGMVASVKPPFNS